MKRRLLAALLTVAMMVGLFPTSMMAAEAEVQEGAASAPVSAESQQDEATASEETATDDTAQQDDTTFNVADNSAYQAAIETIKASEATDFTIVLTGDVRVPEDYIGNGRKGTKLGVEGKKITFKSDENGPWFLAGSATIYVEGDLTLDNVWLNKTQSAGRGQGTVSNFYANGYTVEFTENFKHHIATLYGGASGEYNIKSAENTHLIINGDLVNGANVQNDRVYGGGKYYSTTYTGKVTGNVVIDIGGNANTPWIYGGGWNSPVEGNVTINMNGGHVSQINGGGAAAKDGPTGSTSATGRFAGTVGGNITLNLNSGTLGNLSAGGGSVNDGGFEGVDAKNQTAQYIQSLNDKYRTSNYLFYATVGGNVTVNLGTENALLDVTSGNNMVAGSLYSVIQGDLNVTVNNVKHVSADSTKYGLEAMGTNDIVEGKVNVVMNGGDLAEIRGLGEAWMTSYGTHEIGRSDDEQEGYYYPKDALNITVNGGTVGNVVWFQQIRKTGGTSHYDEPQIYGNVNININGGNIGSVYISEPNAQNPDSLGEGIYADAYIRGTKGIELHITGGKFSSYPSIYAHELRRSYMGQRIYFENATPVELYQINGANAQNNADYNGGTADIIVNNSAPATVMYYNNGNEYPALEDCGSIDIQKGTLALGGENTIDGDFTISDQGTLALAAKDDTHGLPNGVLNAGGEVTTPDGQTGGLKVVDGGYYAFSGGRYRLAPTTTEVTPNVGEVYLRAQATNETAASNSDSDLLDLKNSNAAGRYVEYTTDADAVDSYKHAWRIAQGDVQEQPWYYEVYYESIDSDTNKSTWAKHKGGQGGEAAPDATVSISHETFDGEELGWDAPYGQGPEKLGTHYEFDAENENNRLTATCAEATEKKPLKIYYRAKRSDVTYAFEGDVKPENADDLLPKTEQKPYGSTVEIAAAPTADGYTFSGWTLKEPDYITDGDIKDGTFTMPNEKVTLVGSWTKNEEEPKTPVTIRPADMTIYTGGDSYEGVVDGTGEPSKSDKGLPEAGFFFTVPDEINEILGGKANAADLSKYLTFTVDVEGTEKDRTWNVALYSDGDTSKTDKDDNIARFVYRMNPAEGQDPVRLEFTKDGHTVVSDVFKLTTTHQNETYEMALYTGENVELTNVKANFDFTNLPNYTGEKHFSYPVTTESGQLKIRGVSENVNDETQIIGPQDNLEEKLDNDRISAVAPDDVKYYVNDSMVEITDKENVKLLKDRVLETDALEKHLESDENLTNGDYQFDFVYMDLVDSSNGNAYVTMGEGQKMTLYWPVPDDAKRDGDFYVAHFYELDRDSDVSGEDALSYHLYKDGDATHSLSVETIGGTDYVKFATDSFSPFALVYEKEGSGTIDPPPVDPGEPGGGGDNPPALNTEDHFSYVVGYEDGMVKPQRNITRAEVSSIFYRLLEDEVRDDNTTDVSDFSDVSASDWYGTTVATLSKMGIVKGYEDGTFRPNAPITRAEFAAIATRFFEETGAEYEPGTFIDVTGDEWFAGAIQDAVNLGLIGGYEDGSVRPNNNITRAEACAIVNRTLGRVPDADHLLPTDEMKTWPDNQPSDWFYADMQEATNGHEYEWITEDGNKVEEWTKIMLDNDWEDR
ncbi:MAG: S-layer homology domain-containing protein [Peptococcaceae bacterium]|nr:S-layer homology domain-containing protein [Peptococcaceae bacterium]